MKDIIRKNLRSYDDPVKRGNALREELQHLILKILDDGGLFKKICFVGGTALRVLYDLRRFSEDMDFSLQMANDPGFEFNQMLKYILQQLKIYDLPADTKVKDAGAVHSVFLRFPDILQESGVVKRRGQKIAVKLEIDTNPPAGARFETRLLQRDFMFTVAHHDLPTLFAGKSLAFLNRAYTKGRDIYDMIWFSTKGIKLNREFFDEGLKQTGSTPVLTQEELRNRLVARLEGLEMNAAIGDTRPFLDDISELRFFNVDLIRPLFQKIEFDGNN